jgi:hypothetical protein
MIKCEVCGKEVKNAQGLAGHMNIAHPDKMAVPSAELLSAMKRCEELLNTVIQGLNQIAGAVIKRQDLEQLVTSAVQSSNPGKEQSKERWGFKPKPEPEPEPEPEPKSAKRAPIGSIFEQS